LKGRKTIGLVLAACTILLSLHAITGAMVHEIVGTILFVCIVIHIVQNRKLLSPHYVFSSSRVQTQQRINFVIAYVMIISIIIMVFSGVISSTTLYGSIRIPGLTSLSRTLHLTFSWFLPALFALHFGMNSRHIIPRKKTILQSTGALEGGLPQGGLPRSKNQQGSTIAKCIVSVVIALYGAYGLVVNIIIPYGAMHMGFEYLPSTPIWLYIVQILSELYLFFILGRLLHNR